MVTQVAEHIYRIPVPLPGNPLKNLNAYLIRGPRNLLVDTGFRQEACRAALLAGLAELGVDMAETDIFLTHLHSDHAGLAPELLAPASRLFIGEVDRQRLMVDSEEDFVAHWERSNDMYRSHGFPDHLLTDLNADNPARALSPPLCSRYEGVREGDRFDYGGYRFRALDTPGHTPGHMVLWEAEHGILLLGDHVLFDITPNIVQWLNFDGSLRHYLASLEKVKALPVQLPLPAHRTVHMELRERIDEIIAHHGRRCAEAVQVLRKHSGLTAYELTGRMTWDIRARNWEEFPTPQKWFATGEALAHLEYLMEEGTVTRYRDGNTWRFRTT